jgi:hypothetical protein
MDVKLSHLVLIYGVAGAREKFEELTTQLIHSERPDTDRIRIVHGDGGIDSFAGSLIDPVGVDVYQMKYFPDGIDESQQEQIRNSFRRVRDSKEFKTKSWTLCLPTDMSIPERKWFEEWVKTQKDSGNKIEKPWGALKLESLLFQDKNRHVRESFFKQEYLTDLRSIGSNIEKLLHEFTERVPKPTAGTLTVKLEGINARNSYLWEKTWQGHAQLLVEVCLCFRAENAGTKAISKWAVGCEVDVSNKVDPERLITKEQFPQLGSSGGVRLDDTILPSLSLTSKLMFGLVIREPFEFCMWEILNAITVTVWGITEDGVGNKTTVLLREAANLREAMPDFAESFTRARKPPNTV